MLTALTLAAALFQTTAGVVWESPAPRPDPAAAEAPAETPLTPATTLPDWALPDPFGWERSQCSPLIRGATSLEVCQSRVRSELSTALGDRLPAGLRPSGDPVPCQATPDASGAYPVQCGAPESAGVQVVSVPQGSDCRDEPTDREGGLKVRLFGDD